LKVAFAGFGDGRLLSGGYDFDDEDVGFPVFEKQ